MTEEDGSQRILDTIDGPSDLRGLSDDELQRLAQEVREHIVEIIGQKGGHFGANLGTCELAVALHSVLESPKDKILWDVGHQAYPHKILTGRRDELGTIREYGGLAPFCHREESDHDIMGAGHASTSVSYGVGIKEAMRLGGSPGGRVVAVIGDGAMTGGVAFEALNNAGHLQTPMVVVLNDNDMSISPNVGAVSKHFQRIRLKRDLHRARSDVENTLTRLPAGLGDLVGRLGPQVKEAIKAFYAPGLIYEELDFAYVGVIDGHDVGAVREALARALEADRPVLVHVRTVKGKGFKPAEEGGPAGMEKWHAAKPDSIVDGKPAPKRVPGGAGAPSVPQWTEVFGRQMVFEAERDARVVGITAAMAGGTGLSMLAEKIPTRCFDVGIAEQHAVLFAAGLAVGGMKPVVAIYSTFLQRAFDQVVHDVALQRLGVVFAMDRAGLVGDDGPTHHGTFDISYLRFVPNVVLMAPRDEAMLCHMLHTALLHEGGPTALRYPRGSAVGVQLPVQPHAIDIGKAEVLAEGDRVALLGYGTGVGVATAAGRVLKEHHDVTPTVVDARFAKPLDTALLKDLAADHELLVTIEDGSTAGGFGSGVDEFFSAWPDRPRVVNIGTPDRFVTHGKPALLYREVGFTGEQVAERTFRELRSQSGSGRGASSRSDASPPGRRHAVRRRTAK